MLLYESIKDIFNLKVFLILFQLEISQISLFKLK